MRFLRSLIGISNDSALRNSIISSPSSSLNYIHLGLGLGFYSSCCRRSIVTSCRAVLLPHFGGPEVLEIRDNVPVPDLKPDEVLVRARAVSVNPLDLRVCVFLDRNMNNTNRIGGFASCIDLILFLHFLDNGIQFDILNL